MVAAMGVRREPPPSGPDDPADASPTYFEALGRAIQALRAERGLSRADLADKAGLSYSYLSEIETGKKAGLSSKALLSIARALDVTVGELVGVTEERVLPTMVSPSAPLADLVAREPSSSQMDGSAEDVAAPRASWFRSRARLGESVLARRSTAAVESGRSAALAELAEILPQLPPEDLALVVEFARRLRR